VYRLQPRNPIVRKNEKGINPFISPDTFARHLLARHVLWRVWRESGEIAGFESEKKDSSIAKFIPLSEGLFQNDRILIFIQPLLHVYL
jgi:hypothetical protein